MTNDETEHANGSDRSGRRNRCRCLIVYAKGDTTEVLPEAHGRSSKQRKPHETCRGENYGEWKRRSVWFPFDSTSLSLLRASPSSLRLPLLYPLQKGAVSLINYLPTESNYLGSTLYLLLDSIQQRVCTREGPVPARISPIAPGDGFLHDIRPHLTAHPPVCAKIELGWRKPVRLSLLAHWFVLGLGMFVVAVHFP